MAKKLTSVYQATFIKTDEGMQAGFFIYIFYFLKKHEATFFSSLKKTDEGHLKQMLEGLRNN